MKRAVRAITDVTEIIIYPPAFVIFVGFAWMLIGFPILTGGLPMYLRLIGWEIVGVLIIIMLLYGIYLRLYEWSHEVIEVFSDIGVIDYGMASEIKHKGNTNKANEGGPSHDRQV